jgi:hypothetical protein
MNSNDEPRVKRDKLIDIDPYATPNAKETEQTEEFIEYSGKVYNTLSIAIATIFGSVLAAGLLIYSNYNHFKQKSLGLVAAVLTGVFTLLFMFSMLVIDFPLVMSYLAINFLIAATLLPLNHLFQGRQLELHEEGGRAFHSYIRASLVGASCAIAMILMLLIASTMHLMVF